MIVGDSNTWADFFNGVRSAYAERLEAALRQEEDVAALPIIVTKVLQGFRTDEGFEAARRVLLALPMIHLAVDGHLRAARLFRSLRRQGITVRGAVDCVIAQACLDTEAELLSPDADFEHIARHSPLRLWQA
jgi:hypothetical protein